MSPCSARSRVPLYMTVTVYCLLDYKFLIYHRVLCIKFKSEIRVITMFRHLSYENVNQLRTRQSRDERDATRPQTYDNKYLPKMVFTLNFS